MSDPTRMGKDRLHVSLRREELRIGVPPVIVPRNRSPCSGFQEQAADSSARSLAALRFLSSSRQRQSIQSIFAHAGGVAHIH